MTTPQMDGHGQAWADAARSPLPPSACPIALRTSTIAAMLNAEIATHPVYDGFELQWFDDPAHGTGMLAFLTRRDGHSVDYYAQRGLRLDKALLSIGGGIHSWNEVDFAEASLSISDDGVEAVAVFTAFDGAEVEIRINDRDGTPRRRGGLLAPVGAGVDHPQSLMLVWMPHFDLVREVTGRVPVVRIGGEDVVLGSLPGRRWHRRHLIKAASPLWVIEVNRQNDIPATEGGHGRVQWSDDHRRVGAIVAPVGDGYARLTCEPGFADLTLLEDGATRRGTWTVAVGEGDASSATMRDRALTLAGGLWTATAAPGRVEVHLAVTQGWRPRRLPWLMRLVTTVVPLFRRWPTTYAWKGTVPRGGGPVRGQWVRTGSARGEAYRRATGS